jgi:hypothetical protein
VNPDRWPPPPIVLTPPFFFEKAGTELPPIPEPDFALNAGTLIFDWIGEKERLSCLYTPVMGSLPSCIDQLQFTP